MTEVEQHVDTLPLQTEHELTGDDVRDLFDSGRYERARGMFRGTHFRARCPDGGCYHLRVLGRRAWLHRDRWDPRDRPWMHAAETPEIVAGAPVLSLLTGALIAGLRSRFG